MDEQQAFAELAGGRRAGTGLAGGTFPPEDFVRPGEAAQPAVGHAPSLPKRAASTLYYLETVSLLLELYWSLSAKHRILLAPSGSKMQAVGCYIVKALHQDIQIEYPSPEAFKRGYSVGIGKRWLIDLGRLSDRLSALAKAERREYLEIKI